MPAERLESLFVVRHHILDNLMSSVKELGATPSPHHTLLVGPRGSGKTHLISLVYHRSAHLVEQGRCERLRIAWLPEDPWTIVSYSRLLAAILERLSPDTELNGVDEAELDARIRITSREDGPILILMENVDRILEALGDLGQQRFRNLLQTESGILIIGSTTVLDRTLSDHAYPFFEFFDTIRLKPFSPAQARDMLRALAKESGNEDLVNALEGDGARARIHTIAHLAGGQPRLWALLGSALTVDELNDLTNLLLNRFDDLTPFFQEQLARLSPQQRLVVAELAAADRPLSVKELAGRIGADQRSAAKTVNDLTDRGWLKPVSTIFANLLDRRRTYYELAEPLARLAFQIKESRGEPLPLIIDFLISWFDADQLRVSDNSAYGQAALMEMEQDEVGGLVRQLTSLPDSRIPSLDLLGRVEDALAAISDGDAEPIMSLQSTLRQAIEYRAGPSLNIAPIRLELLESALEEVGDVPRRQSSAKWVTRAERLDREMHSSGSRLMLVRWLAASWYFDEAEVALYTMGISHHKNLEANRDRRDSAGRRGRMRGRLRVHVYRSHMPTLPSATTSAQVSETDFIDEEDSIFSEEGKLTGADTVARAYISAGLVDQAIPLFVQNLTDREHLLGPDHPDTLTARNNLASAYRDAGKLEQAINLHEQALTDRKRILGPDHPDVFISRNNLALTYQDSGELEQAINLFEQNLADLERVLGPDHPDTLTARNNLASAYRDAGRLKQAINLHEQTSTDFERVLGPDHTHTLTSRNNLARAYQDAGRLEQAINLFEQTLADRERVLGPDHPHTLTSRDNLARAYQDADRLEQAIDLFEQNLTDSERILGPNHPWTTLFRDNLARAKEARN